MTTINANMSNSIDWIPLSASDAATIAPGTYILDSEYIVVGGPHLVRPAQPSSPLNGRWCSRAQAGSTAATHSSGATLTRYYPDAPGGSVSNPLTEDLDADGNSITGAGFSTDADGPKFYFGSDDPADTQTVAPGDVWVRSVTASLRGGELGPYYRVMQRYAGDETDGWAPAAMVAIDDDEPTVIRAALEVQSIGHVLATAANASGSYARIDIDSDGTVRLTAESADGNTVVEFGVDSVLGFPFLSGQPVSDPEVQGAIYSAGTPGPGDPKALMISGGPAA